MTAPDTVIDDPAAWELATRRAPSDTEHLDLDLAWRIVRGVTSNAIVLVRERRLIGALPLYLKDHSMGEFVFDWAWADAYERHGLAYYPRLVAAILASHLGSNLVGLPLYWPGRTFGPDRLSALPPKTPPHEEHHRHLAH